LKNKNLEFSYLALRLAIGWLGVFLPVLLIIGSGIFSRNDYWLQPSISHYYYSVMHFAFLCVMVLLGAILMFYTGASKTENRISTLAGIAAWLVAIFPTNFDKFYGTAYLEKKDIFTFSNNLHFTAAFVLFMCFMYFCFVLFQNPDNNYTTEEAIAKKKRRNMLYKTCGFVILASIVTISLFSFDILPKESFPDYTFYFECTALWAFGISWIIKGSDLFKDSKIFKMIR
jgi:hypothetical protein